MNDMSTHRQAPSHKQAKAGTHRNQSCDPQTVDYSTIVSSGSARTTTPKSTAVRGCFPQRILLSLTDGLCCAPVHASARPRKVLSVYLPHWLQKMIVLRRLRS